MPEKLACGVKGKGIPIWLRVALNSYAVEKVNFGRDKAIGGLDHAVEVRFAELAASQEFKFEPVITLSKADIPIAGRKTYIDALLPKYGMAITEAAPLKFPRAAGKVICIMLTVSVVEGVR